MIHDDDGKRGSGQSAPHETQQGADTPDQRASVAVGNVADQRRTPLRHQRSAGPSSSTSIATLDAYSLAASEPFEARWGKK